MGCSIQTSAVRILLIIIQCKNLLLFGDNTMRVKSRYSIPKVIAKNINTLAYNDCLKEEPDVVQSIEGFGKFCGSLTMEHVKTILKESTGN